MNYKKFALLKFFLLIIALGLAFFLLFSENSKDFTPDHKIVFVLDINKTMNTRDVFSGDIQLSRLDAAKQMIARTIVSKPGFSYGLILFNAGTDYIIPPTFDTGTFFLYLINVTSNLLPDGMKNLSSFTGLLKDEYVTYILFSDFDTIASKLSLPRDTFAIGLGSTDGDIVRYANGLRYYNNGSAVYSARNDEIGQSLDVPYITVSHVDDFIVDTVLSHGISLPLSQRIFLYTLLGILVILVVMF